MSQTIFVVEDDRDIAQLLRHNIEAAGYAVRLFSSTAGVLPEGEKQPPVLFLLDIMLPGADGMELCRLIRRSSSLHKLPIIFLSAKNSEIDRVSGLEQGGDDYIVKPFSPREVVARIRAVLRRFEKPLESNVIVIGEVKIDSGAMELTVRDKTVMTTATEFRLLDYFARHSGRVFTRDQLLDAVWKDTAFVTPRSVDVYVRRIREKIEKDPESPRLLKTVRGAGYRFEVPK
ncbi:MAG TPA: response regulator transcription factor [Terriglobales bacterium]|nr:response regulator transcription factor [Terriglobales bacterium]